MPIQRIEKFVQRQIDKLTKNIEKDRKNENWQSCGAHECALGELQAVKRYIEMINEEE